MFGFVLASGLQTVVNGLYLTKIPGNAMAVALSVVIYFISVLYAREQRVVNGLIRVVYGEGGVGGISIAGVVTAVVPNRAWSDQSWQRGLERAHGRRQSAP